MKTPDYAMSALAYLENYDPQHDFSDQSDTGRALDLLGLHTSARWVWDASSEDYTKAVEVDLGWEEAKC